MYVGAHLQGGGGIFRKSKTAKKGIAIRTYVAVSFK